MSFKKFNEFISCRYIPQDISSIIQKNISALIIQDTYRKLSSNNLWHLSSFLFNKKKQTIHENTGFNQLTQSIYKHNLSFSKNSFVELINSIQYNNVSLFSITYGAEEDCFQIQNNLKKIPLLLIFHKYKLVNAIVLSDMITMLKVHVKNEENKETFFSGKFWFSNQFIIFNHTGQQIAHIIDQDADDIIVIHRENSKIPEVYAIDYDEE